MLGKRTQLPMVAALLVTASQILSAQSGTVGLVARILDASRQPVSGDVTVLQGTTHVKSTNYRTGGDGVALLNIDPTSRATIVAKADGYVSQEISVMVSGASPSPTLEFVLPRSSVVTGRVVDRAGNAVPGAAVRIGYPGELRTFVFEQEAGVFRSDEFGYFALPFVAQGKPFVIEATADDWLPAFSVRLLASGEQLQGVTVILDRLGATVRGKVVDATGAPVTGAYVRLHASAKDEGYPAEAMQSRSLHAAANRRARTGVDGSFEFRGVPSGEAVLIAGRTGSRLTKTELIIQKGPTSPIVVSVP